MQTIEVHEGFNVTISNKCSARGHYFAEDDWSVVGIGKTIEEAIENLAEKAVKAELYPDDAYTYKCDFVVYKGRNVILGDHEQTHELSKQELVAMLERNPKYVALKEEKRLKEEAEKQAAALKAKEEQEKKELAELTRLQEKYKKP